MADISLVRAPRKDGRCGLSQRATHPSTSDWKYASDEAGHCDPGKNENLKGPCCLSNNVCGALEEFIDSNNSPKKRCPSGLDFRE